MLYFYLAVAPLLLYFLIKTKKVMLIFQQNRYNEANYYWRWVYKNIGKELITYDLVFIPLYLISLFSAPTYLFFMYPIVYVIIIFLYVSSVKKEQKKIPLAYTKRVKRLHFTLFLLYGLVCYFLTRKYSENIISLYYLVIALMVYFEFITIYIANIINQPVEKLINKYYWVKAHNSLKNMKGMEVIGITGSYGKTTTKNVISEILNVKYNAFPTPRNFNTVAGLCNTVNNYLDKFNDYFIAEMGANHVHEIGQECKLVEPKYGVLTTIGVAHLETFGSMENIENTKFELIESLPSDGLGILNGDDPIQLNHKIKNDVKIMMIGIDNTDVDCYAKNIRLSYKGTKFDVVFKGDNNSYEFETSLLGKANIYNLLSGILLGKYLGIDIDRLKMGVKNVKPYEHRLQLKKSGDINIIDDAYNSNPVGSKMAAEVLGMMPGTRIIVTPGMIELGEAQDELNKKFGTYIADAKIDEVILVGEKQTKPIYEGLKEKKFNEKNIHVINDVKLAFPLIEKLKGKETYVLLENDLPDLFNE